MLKAAVESILEGSARKTSFLKLDHQRDRRPARQNRGLPATRYQRNGSTRQSR
jgi:hypothetical protein